MARLLACLSRSTRPSSNLFFSQNSGTSSRISIVAKRCGCSTVSFLSFPSTGLMFNLYFVAASLYILQFSIFASSRVIEQPFQPSNPQIQDLLLLNASIQEPSLEAELSKRALPPSPATITAYGPIFNIPRSALVLKFSPRQGASAESINSILLTSDAFVARKISIWGPESPMSGSIFEHGTGEHPYTRLIVWSAIDEWITWGQMRTMIDGLWIFLVDRRETEYTYWEIFHRETGQLKRLGYGAIVDTDIPRPKPPGLMLGNGTSNSASTSKRDLQISTPEEPLALNASDPLSAS